MIQYKVGQQWDITVPSNSAYIGYIGRPLPAKPGETYRVQILAVNATDFTVTVATPGMGWTERMSFEFLSDAGRLIEDVA